METQSKDMEVINRRRGSKFNNGKKDLVVRFLALTLALVAAIVLGVNKETTTVKMTLVQSLPPVDLPVTAKWTHMSAFVYLVIANSIACLYVGTSLILILITKGKHELVSLVITILDLVMVALLFSAVGATGSVGVIAYKGNSHVQWDKVCNVFDKFCHRVATALFLSFAGSIMYLLLVVIAVSNLHKKY